MKNYSAIELRSFLQEGKKYIVVSTGEAISQNEFRQIKSAEAIELLKSSGNENYDDDDIDELLLYLVDEEYLEIQKLEGAAREKLSYEELREYCKRFPFGTGYRI